MMTSVSPRLLTPQPTGMLWALRRFYEHVSGRARAPSWYSRRQLEDLVAALSARVQELEAGMPVGPDLLSALPASLKAHLLITLLPPSAVGRLACTRRVRMTLLGRRRH